MIYRFGDCELDMQLFSLRRGGAPLPLRPKVFQVLTYLLEQRHRVVTRQELFEQVWPQQFVSDAALESCIKAVRQAIGDSGARPGIIQTLRGYGYRFMAVVETDADMLAGVPILLLTTSRPGYRPPWMAKSHMTQIALHRLTSDDSLRVVQAVFHTTQIPAALARMILAKADGNPFFLEELARTVREHREHRLALLVPDTVQAVLAARIDRLPPEEKCVLQTAAVIAKDVAFPLLQALIGLPVEELQQRVAHLQEAEFIYETARFPELAYTFKHVLIQEVAYESLLRSTRQQIHQRITQALVQHFPETAEVRPELLAHHCTEAGLGEQAVGYWQAAGPGPGPACPGPSGSSCSPLHSWGRLVPAWRVHRCSGALAAEPRPLRPPTVSLP